MRHGLGPSLSSAVSGEWFKFKSTQHIEFEDYYILQDEATAALDPDLLPDHPHGLWCLMGCQASDQEVNITAQKPQIIFDHVIVIRSPQDPPPAEGDEAAKPPVWCNFALPWR